MVLLDRHFYVLFFLISVYQFTLFTMKIFCILELKTIKGCQYEISFCQPLLRFCFLFGTFLKFVLEKSEIWNNSHCSLNNYSHGGYNLVFKLCIKSSKDISLG